MTNNPNPPTAYLLLEVPKLPGYRVTYFRILNNANYLPENQAEIEKCILPLFFLSTFGRTKKSAVDKQQTKLSGTTPQIV